MSETLEWLPLPPARGRHRCPITSLGRTAIERLCVPSAQNNMKPPVASKIIKLPGESQGRRMIYAPSLRAWFNKAGEVTP